MKGQSSPGDENTEFENKTYTASQKQNKITIQN